MPNKTMKTFAFVNQKGGAGKSTSAANVAVGYASQGKRVLMVDMDPQGNLTDNFGIDTDGVATIYEVLMGEDSVEDAIISHKLAENLVLDILPADIALSPIELQLAPVLGKEKRLRKVLDLVADKYDYCFIDCPPALGLLLNQSLTAADYVIIPANPSKHALKGIKDLNRTIEAIRENTNENLKVIGILFNRFNPRWNSHQKKLVEAQEKAAEFGTKVFKTTIRQATVVEESNDEEVPVILFNMASNPAQDYIKFVNELMTEGY